jgi:hypothetical protein
MKLSKKKSKVGLVALTNGPQVKQNDSGSGSFFKESLGVH